VLEIKVPPAPIKNIQMFDCIILEGKNGATCSGSNRRKSTILALRGALQLIRFTAHDKTGSMLQVRLISIKMRHILKCGLFLSTLYSGIVFPKSCAAYIRLRNIPYCGLFS